MSLSGSSLSRCRSWAMTRLAMVSSIGVPRKMIRSLSSREKMSNERSPRLVCSMTMGTRFASAIEQTSGRERDDARVPAQRVARLNEPIGAARRTPCEPATPLHQPPKEVVQIMPVPRFAPVFGAVYVLVGLLGCAFTGFADFAVASDDKLLLFGGEPAAQHRPPRGRGPVAVLLPHRVRRPHRQHPDRCRLPGGRGPWAVHQRQLRPEPPQHQPA